MISYYTTRGKIQAFGCGVPIVVMLPSTILNIRPMQQWRPLGVARQSGTLIQWLDASLTSAAEA
jgi:hypothetical protein